MDEQTAVKASQRGNKAAFGVLIDRHYKNIYRYAYQFTGNLQDADDICQETFLRAFDCIGQLKDSKSFKEWIFKIASNLSRKRMKTESSNKSIVSIFANSSDKRNKNYGMQPEENLSRKEKAELIRRHLKEMSEHLRMVTVLVFMEGFAQKEAARILNRSESTISRDLENARNWLRSRLRDLV